MISLYNTISKKCSKSITETYSTSFSSGVKMLGKNLQLPIHAIYGFVRVADEIVDTFHDHDQAVMLKEFREETYKALDRGISTNPVLHSFQWVVREYGIDREFIDTFLDSMAMDLEKIQYNQALYEKYILGSAQVVGLMCLRVFCNGDKELFEQLKGPAMSLGSAFQKVNFLRDINADVNQLGRLYFPNVNLNTLTNAEKQEIEREIDLEFQEALKGIKQLPKSSKFGVFTAYRYYRGLLHKIMRVPAERLFQERIRISNGRKLAMLLESRTVVGIGQV